MIPFGIQLKHNLGKVDELLASELMSELFKAYFNIAIVGDDARHYQEYDILRALEVVWLKRTICQLLVGNLRGEIVG